jgi:hypothetical protein
MANIKVQNLTDGTIVGADLFKDLESFMQELSESELNNLHGGLGTPLSPIIITFVPD